MGDQERGLVFRDAPAVVAVVAEADADAVFAEAVAVVAEAVSVKSYQPTEPESGTRNVPA
jgi:hypothetical protein